MRSSRRRLRRAEVQAVLTHGARFFSPLFSITAIPFPSGGAFSVVVPKKVAVKATERNRLRRRLYAILDASSGAYPPLRAVVSVRGKARNLPFDALRKEIASALSSASSRLSPR